MPLRKVTAQCLPSKSKSLGQLWPLPPGHWKRKKMKTGDNPSTLSQMSIWRSAGLSGFWILGLTSAKYRVWFKASTSSGSMLGFIFFAKGSRFSSSTFGGKINLHSWASLSQIRAQLRNKRAPAQVVIWIHLRSFEFLTATWFPNPLLFKCRQVARKKTSTFGSEETVLLMVLFFFTTSLSAGAVTTLVSNGCSGGCGHPNGLHPG